MTKNDPDFWLLDPADVPDGCVGNTQRMQATVDGWRSKGAAGRRRFAATDEPGAFGACEFPRHMRSAGRLQAHFVSQLTHSLITVPWSFLSGVPRNQRLSPGHYDSA
ncbi:hypothetical protein D3C72_1602480 [compost metagenome]